ncbi:MAG: GWxTD domain-containing protein [Gemmatimonadales bacterium]
MLPALMVLGAASCGSWKRVGTPETAPTPSDRLPQLFDPTFAYRQMGLLADDGPLGFIANVRIIAGPRPDSMLVAVGVSLHNHGFTFRRDGDQFVAEYHADVTLRGAAGTVAAQVSREERVQVASFRETQRADESIIFQQFLTAVPGEYVVAISVRDRNSANTGRVETGLRVPPLRAQALSLPVAVYRATPRHTLDSAPGLVMNPRQVVQYGSDSLFVYLETYGLPVGTQVVLSAVDAAGQASWADTSRVASLAPVIGRTVAVPPGPLSIGRYELRLDQGGTLMASTPFLVAFSDLYAAANLEDIVSLLRFFAPADTLRALLHTPPSERGAAWQRFWKSTDPNPATPENEAIDEYLRRVQVANDRFRDEGVQGWLTERGEVFISLGEPSEVLDRRSETGGRGRFIVWTYLDYRLTLNFIDDAGFGRYRLDPRSRAEFQRVANRVRGW